MPGAGDGRAGPEADSRWMDEALGLAREAAAAGDVPVGAVLVRGGACLARARNTMREGGALGHAEMRAIASALEATGGPRLEGCALYVTLEPCAMCAGAIVLARIERVVFGAWDEKAGMAGSVGDLLRHPRLNHSPEVLAGVRAAAAGALLREFFAARR